MKQTLLKAFLFISLAVIPVMYSRHQALAASRCLGNNYVIDLRAGSLLGADNEQADAAYNTLHAMINNGVVDYNENWKFNEYDLDKDGTKDLIIDDVTAEYRETYLYSVIAENSIKSQVTVNINSGTKEALIDDGYDYYESLTFRFPESLPVSISNASVSGIENKTYNSKSQTQTITVKTGDLLLQDGTHYTVAYKDNKNPGTATVTITGKGTCTGTITKSFQISKASNPVTMKAKTVNLKYSKVKKKKQTISAKKAFSVKNAKGAVTYKVTKKDSKAKNKITVSSSGKVTVRKGLKKGTYKLKVKITAAGNNHYHSARKIVTLTVKIK